GQDTGRIRGSVGAQFERSKVPSEAKALARALPRGQPLFDDHRAPASSRVDERASDGLADFYVDGDRSRGEVYFGGVFAARVAALDGGEFEVGRRVRLADFVGAGQDTGRIRGSVGAQFE